VFIVLVIRSLTVLACALANLAKDRTNPWGNRRQLLTLRGFLGFGGNGGYFWTVTLLPLNDAVVLTFLAPAWVAILSPLLLREKPGKFTWFAIPVCIAGVCLIARPEMETDQHKAHLHLAGIIVGLFQAFFSGTAKMCVRELRSSEAPNVIVFYLAFISSLGALTGIIGQAIFYPGTLIPPTTAKQIITCIIVGALGYGAQITLTYGLRSAKAAPAIATSYLSVVWGILGSLFIFHEKPTGQSIAGAILIIGCTGALGFMEKKKAKPAAETSQDEQALLVSEGRPDS
jgi:drug/metabolite transporter (DMT)-like permease